MRGKKESAYRIRRNRFGAEPGVNRGAESVPDTAQVQRLSPRTLDLEWKVVRFRAAAIGTLRIRKLEAMTSNGKEAGKSSASKGAEVVARETGAVESIERQRYALPTLIVITDPDRIRIIEERLRMALLWENLK